VLQESRVFCPDICRHKIFLIRKIIDGHPRQGPKVLVRYAPLVCGAQERLAGQRYPCSRISRDGHQPLDQPVAARRVDRRGKPTAPEAAHEGGKKVGPGGKHQQHGLAGLGVAHQAGGDGTCSRRKLRCHPAALLFALAIKKGVPPAIARRARTLIQYVRQEEREAWLVVVAHEWLQEIRRSPRYRLAALPVAVSAFPPTWHPGDDPALLQWLFPARTARRCCASGRRHEPGLAGLATAACMAGACGTWSGAVCRPARRTRQRNRPPRELPWSANCRRATAPYFPPHHGR